MADKNIDNITIGFIGFGLIGGSIAKSIKTNHPDITMLGYQHGEELSEDNKLALDENILSLVTPRLDGFSKCDIIFLCAPVIKNIEYLSQLKGLIKEDCIITDVGSVKANIHESVTKYKLESNFVGGHPMTGSEKSGYKHSNSKLFENTYYILTPTKTTPESLTNKMIRIVEVLNAIPILLDYTEHDKIVAAISHLPHIIAASLVNLVKKQDGKGDLMKKLAAGGFRDITRIASSSPTVWENISIANSDFIRDYLNQYTNALKDISNALDKKDCSFLYDTFASAKHYRNELPEKGRGVLQRIYEIHVDIDDEAGAIASLATLLANNKINIKNIGIIHNREFYDGVLRIELYEEETLDNAVILLKEKNYIVYER